jgi:diguanylate cyclase (GGDEF)-like protein
MTDVNGLKLINDTYGHEAGDELLKKYADLLREII